MLDRNELIMSFSAPGFDIGALEEAINRGDRPAVEELLGGLFSRLEGDGSQLFAISAESWILSELYRRGSRVSRRGEDVFLNTLREISRCSDRESAFSVLVRFCMSLSGISRRAQPRAADRQYYIRRAVDYMGQVYGNPDLKLEEVAQYAYISASYLTRLIRQELGTSFSALLTRIRMENAARLLEEGGYRNYEVAARCGFANATYFSTVFREHFGMTPTEYRKSRGSTLDILPDI